MTKWLFVPWSYSPVFHYRRKMPWKIIKFYPYVRFPIVQRRQMWSTKMTFAENQILHYLDSSALVVLTCSESAGFEFRGAIWLDKRRFCSNRWNPKNSKSANISKNGIDTIIWQISSVDRSIGFFSSVTLLVARVLLVNKKKIWKISIFSNVHLTVQKMQKLLLIFTFLSTIKLFFQVLVVMLLFLFFSLHL